MKNKLQSKNTDVVIVGAGPAGCAASMHLSKLGVDHMLLEKECFPRDKICGDALSGKVVDFFRKTNTTWLNEIDHRSAQFLPSNGVIFGAPNKQVLKVPFSTNSNQNKQAPGFISRRIDFDTFLASKVKNRLMENTEVLSAKRQNDIWEIQTNQRVIKSKIIISAAGAQSNWARKTHNFKIEKDHFCAGLRAYYNGVSGLDPQGFIELHFVKDILPGYFWIFPMAEGYANIGLGMLSSQISKDKINLKQKLQEVLALPQFKERFKSANLEGEILGWGLPLGSKKRPLSDDGILLTGDAASLIDPFTGEGIGNALNSGKLAAECAHLAIQSKNFAQSFLKQHYDQLVYQKLWSELRLSRIMQKLVRFPWLFNLVVNKANKNTTLRHTITCMFEDVDLRAKLKSPKFYLNLLRN